MRRDGRQEPIVLSVKQMVATPIFLSSFRSGLQRHTIKIISINGLAALVPILGSV